MLWLALRELRARRLASLLTVTGVFAATFGFVLLAATSRTTEAQLIGTISSAWGGPYQLLVRPPGSATEFELEGGLVRPNYLSGLSGGIDRRQLEAIRAIAGVELAAPLAVVGFVQWPAGTQLDVSELATGGELDVFRITETATGEAGLSHFELGATRYVLYAPEGSIDQSFRTLTVGTVQLACDSARGITCLTGAGPGSGPTPGTPHVFVSFPVPVLIAGIDPTAEADLVGLDRCVTEGRFLTPDDIPAEVPLPGQPQAQPVLPLLVSKRSFIDQSLLIRIDRADAAQVMEGASPADQQNWTGDIQIEVSADEAYGAFVDSIAGRRTYNASPLWIADAVAYQDVGPDHLAAVPVPPDYSIFENPLVIVIGGPREAVIPVEARDLWFREVTARPPVRRQEIPNGWTTVGEYDPACVAGFPGLAGGFLESYALPGVRLPDGRTMGPTRSVAGYVNTPPLLLTTLETAEWFADTARFTGARGESFISSVRVRLSGVESPGPAAEGRLSAVAGRIHEATGLHVDILVGSSPREMSIDLPEGRFGRPALTVREGWAVKGVAFRFVEMVRAQDLALFSLILVAATALVGQTTHIAVRRRRREFAVLRALGWPGGRVWQLVLLEVGLLGLVAGAIALALGVPAARLMGIETAWWQPLLALPIALAVALGGASLPALGSIRERPLRTLAGGAAVSRGQPPGSVAVLALREIARGWRLDALLSSASLALGATLTGGVVLVAASFGQRLDTTLLGLYLAAEVRPFHVVVVLLALLLSALSASVLTTLSYSERQTQLAALRAIGWPPRSVVSYLITGIAVSAVIGGALAAIAVAGVGWLLHASPGPAAIGASAALAAALGSGLLGAAAPLAIAYRLRPAQLLAGGS